MSELITIVNNLYDQAKQCIAEVKELKGRMKNLREAALDYRTLGLAMDERLGLRMTTGDFPEREGVNDAFHGVFCQYLVGSALQYLPDDNTKHDYRAGDTIDLCKAMDQDGQYADIHRMACDMARQGKVGLVYSALLYAGSLMKRSEAVSILIQKDAGF